jgi:cytochrome c-type biogenesis protein CcmH
LEDKGKAAESLAVWRQLVANAPPDAPWLKDAQAEVARLAATNAGTEAAPAAPQTVARAPSAADIAAAGSLPPEQRTAMIEGMVSSLAARLETNSDDAQGWAQLVRSYMVLGRPEDARAALIKAKAALASDQAKAAVVDEAARNAGLMP